MGMTHRERKAAMMLRGLTQQTVAESLGVSRAMVGMVLTNKARSRGLRVERYIAEQLGRTLDDAFPEIATTVAA